MACRKRSNRHLAISNPQRKGRNKRPAHDASYVPTRGCGSLAGVLLSDDESDFEVSHIPRNEKRSIVFNFAEEKARRLEKALGLQDDSWCQAEKDLYLRLSLRGFEALLPAHWRFDFRTLPESLFGKPDDGDDRPLIQASGSSELHAIKSLASLFALGGRVRDCSILDIRPEIIIQRGIQNYLRWATRDGKVFATAYAIPVHAIHCQRRGRSTLSVIQSLDRRLRGLAQRYAPSQHYPLLTGFAICGPICAILTYDTDPASKTALNRDTASKFLCQVNLSDRGQDVWNSLALAMAVINVRESMARSAANGIGGFYCATEKDSTADNDL